MAGDHKCPVCQATFTRPQHVARHMRSHTGDRPYKCQHCGDQFARSDLLSRHVNKCHAGDKPPTTTAPTRRKGASSTRATTSKQACDQCVIATLPCDGANPCSKCIQRKSPCTYVKFQRQTAPVGPGHRHSHSVDSTTSSTSSLIGSVPRPDELFLVPPPLTVPSMGAGELFYPTQFAFNAPSGAPTWDSDSSNLPSLSFSGTDSGADSDQPRFPDSDMIGSAALGQPSYTQGIGSGAGFAANPNDFYVLQHQQPQQQTVAPTDTWQFSTDFRLPSQRKVDEGFAQYLPSGSSAQLPGASAMVNPTNLDFNGGSGLYSLQTRRSSVDGFSDGSGFSAPNSAASSSTHLPVEFGPTEQSQSGQQIQPLSMLYQFDENHHPPPSREGRVASSFGLMSLADGDSSFIGNFNGANNNVNMDGTAPFFTQHAMKLPPQDSTPRPFRSDENRAGQAVSSPRDREVEMRELKEFWKQYLRTPLTGPSLGATPKAELINNQLGAFGDGSRPTPKRGLSRVASLPSVRTPPDEKVSAVPPRVTNSHSQSHAQLPVLQANDDLKSYEQAVLARKPLNLTFVPRKGRHSISSSASPQPMSEQQQQQMFQRSIADNGLVVSHGLHPRPGPLAALGSTDGGNSSDDNPVPGEHLRPGFKRLASQTLENATQKRTMFRWGEPEDVIDDSESDADGPSDTSSPPNRFDAANPGFRTSSMSPTSYHRNMQFAHAGMGPAGSGAETLLDRFRRQSAPSGLRPNIGGVDTSNVKMSESSPSPVSYNASPLQASHTAENVQMNAPRPGLPGIDSDALLQT